MNSDTIAAVLRERVAEISPDWQVTQRPAGTLGVSSVIMSLYGRMIYSLIIHGNTITMFDYHLTIDAKESRIPRTPAEFRTQTQAENKQRTVLIVDLNDPTSLDQIEAILLEKYKLVGRINDKLAAYRNRYIKARAAGNI